jgi:hypothetical protein
MGIGARLREKTSLRAAPKGIAYTIPPFFKKNKKALDSICDLV